MPEGIMLKKLEKNLAFFQKMYDAVRLVDPIRKEVLEFQGFVMGEKKEVCYTYWQNGKICDNCISVRAYHNNKSYMKLEQGPDFIMMVTALPLEIAERPVVLELLKDATDSMLLGSGNYNSGESVRNMILEINDMVIRDQLTSLYNRRFVDERLPADIVKATLEDWPLSIIFIDMDNLKEINDTYGHNWGDLALRNVADTIKNCIRTDQDWAARYGGDEFLICLNNTSNDNAYRIAERIRNMIESRLVPIESKFPLSISLGVHTMQEYQLTAEEIIGIADQKMYEAKRNGKNRTVGSSNEK